MQRFTQLGNAILVAPAIERRQRARRFISEQSGKR